jgi:hypothetical protein
MLRHEAASRAAALRRQLPRPPDLGAQRLGAQVAGQQDLGAGHCDEQHAEPDLLVVTRAPQQGRPQLVGDRLLLHDGVRAAEIRTGAGRRQGGRGQVVPAEGAEVPGERRHGRHGEQAARLAGQALDDPLGDRPRAVRQAAAVLE